MLEVVLLREVQVVVELEDKMVVQMDKLELQTLVVVEVVVKVHLLLIMVVMVDLQVVKKELLEMIHQYQVQVLQQLPHLEVVVLELVFLQKEMDLLVDQVAVMDIMLGS